MKFLTTSSLTLTLLAAGCASAPPDYAKTPPARGADIYRCSDSTGYVYFELVKSGTDQRWLGDHWSPNSCEKADSRCKSDDAGLFVVETTVVLPSSGDRIDKIDIYNPKAGTVLSSIALNGHAAEPHRNTCTPHS